ncbi:hypothetical protein ACEWPN_09875 [Yoonia sp. R2-816]
MRLLVFVVFAAVAAIAIAIHSYFAGVGVAGIALRVFAVLVVLQIVYFLLLVVTSLFSPSKHQSTGKGDLAGTLPERAKRKTNPSAR